MLRDNACCSAQQYTSYSLNCAPPGDFTYIVTLVNLEKITENLCEFSWRFMITFIRRKLMNSLTAKTCPNHPMCTRLQLVTGL